MKNSVFLGSKAVLDASRFDTITFFACFSTRFIHQGLLTRHKCALFFAGWPPVRIVDGRVQTLLADEHDGMIDIPTCHIVGCNDPYIHGAIALYGMCDEDMAILFDHGKGHTVPRDELTVKELAETIERTFDQAAAFSL